MQHMPRRTLLPPTSTRYTAEPFLSICSPQGAHDTSNKDAWCHSSLAVLLLTGSTAPEANCGLQAS